MPDFYTVITDSGLSSLTLATQGNKLFLPQAVVGDGNGTFVTPSKGMTSLVNEVWRGDVSGVHSVESDPNTIIFEFVIKADIGGFIIREVGLVTENGDLFCVGNFPETEKPVINDGSVRDLTIRLPLHFENAETVNLVVDTNVVVATKQDVFDHNDDPQAHGIMKSDAVDLNSSEKVATSKAVKTTYDSLTVHKTDTSAHGIVKSDAVNSATSDFATSKAVKLVHDQLSQHAESVSTHGDASTTTWGFVRLATDSEHVECIVKNAAATPWGLWQLVKSIRCDAVTDSSSEKLATAYAVKRVNDALTIHQNEDDPHGIGKVMQGFNIVNFTSSGTYHKPSNLISAEVYVTGGGGSGGLISEGDEGAGGGGAGGTSVKTYSADELPDTVSVIVGGGGLWETVNANAGGYSCFLSQYGDGGKTSDTYGNGGIGGEAAGGDLNLPGSGGAHADMDGYGGQGGSSYWGGSGIGCNASPSENLHGRNGSGGSGRDSETSASGNGGDGFVVIKEFLGRV